ncbi:GTPase Era [Proteinivorax hydrogeniformans]|uniref:GTPase Era n=1 Tax=Proteinivorax hydrogeniformans TaxID=1826727 RepID=A0AAU8HWM8_9FIRM
MSFKSGFISIVGRTNVGKSTLLNNVLDQKIAITSNKAQTTRTKIQGILSSDDYQMVFIDTPGIHKPKSKLGETMVKVARRSVVDVEAICFITDISQPIKSGDRFILEQLKTAKAPVILIANKIDLTDPDQAKERIAEFKEMFNFSDILAISALEGVNVDSLPKLLLKYLDEGPKFYPDDMITDQPERVIVQELLREKILELTRDEIPHGVAIEIITFKENAKGTIEISANIYVERESHKGIVIGKGGKLLKEIGKRARIDVENFLQTKVFLEVWVKVKKGWRDKHGAIKDFGLLGE